MRWAGLLKVKDTQRDQKLIFNIGWVGGVEITVANKMEFTSKRLEDIH